jgi:hypothetical protein
VPKLAPFPIVELADFSSDVMLTSVAVAGPALWTVTVSIV